MFFFPLICSADIGKTPEGDLILLEEGKVYSSDFFATGSSVEISGIVQGDAFIAAGQTLIDGVIEGDLLVFSGGVEISGEVKGNVRALGGQVNISGIVKGNVTVVAGNAQVSNTAIIFGNAVITSANTDISGEIKGDCHFVCSHLKISGVINGNIISYVSEMRLTSKAKIFGALDYKSNSEAWIDDKAIIKGGIQYHPAFFRSFFEWSWFKGIVVGSKILAFLMNFTFTFVFGWILIKLFPSKLTKTIQVLDKNIFSSIGVGLVLLVILPILSILLLISLIGAPFALALIALNIFGFYTAKIFVVVWIANYIADKIHLKKERLFHLFLGLLLYYTVTAIPYVGSFIALITMLLGVGAIILAQSEKNVFISITDK
jgi:cytoskeletal protein CcmA (bactofilin family)